ncbi:cytochrome P450 [Mycobacterium tuberculosis]|nr:cytochrome P450 [Mycobacterium tuberculosis]
MATATTQRPLKGPAKRMSTWTMTREAITIGFDAGDGFLGRLRGSDITRFRCAGRRFVSISHPDYVDHVLHEARLKYVKSDEYGPTGPPPVLTCSPTRATHGQDIAAR